MQVHHECCDLEATGDYCMSCSWPDVTVTVGTPSLSTRGLRLKSNHIHSRQKPAHTNNLEMQPMKHKPSTAHVSYLSPTPRMYVITQYPAQLLTKASIASAWRPKGPEVQDIGQGGHALLELMTTHSSGHSNASDAAVQLTFRRIKHQVYMPCNKSVMLLHP